MDLRRKIPLGSELRVFFETVGVRPVDFDHFIALVRRFQMTKPPPKGEAGRVAREGELWSEEPGDYEEDWADEAEVPEDEEAAFRLNDARMACRRARKAGKAKVRVRGQWLISRLRVATSARDVTERRGVLITRPRPTHIAMSRSLRET